MCICVRIAQPGEWGLTPILDKLESFVVNALQYVVSRVSNKKTPRFASGSFLFYMYRNARLHFYPRGQRCSEYSKICVIIEIVSSFFVVVWRFGMNCLLLG